MPSLSPLYNYLLETLQTKRERYNVEYFSKYRTTQLFISIVDHFIIENYLKINKNNKLVYGDVD